MCMQVCIYVCLAILAVFFIDAALLVVILSFLNMGII